MDPAGVERAAWTEKAARTRVHQRAGAGQLGSWAEAAVQCGGLSSGRCDEREGVMGGWGGGARRRRGFSAAETSATLESSYSPI